MLASCLALGLALIPFTRASQGRTPVEVPSASDFLRVQGSLGTVASVSIRAGFEVDGTVVHEQLLRSSPEGTFSLQWQASESWTKARLESRTVFAEVAERGHQRRFRRKFWEQPSVVPIGEPPEVLLLPPLWLARGSDVDVRVVDPNGAPIMSDLAGWRCSEAGEWKSEDLDVEFIATGRFRVFLEGAAPAMLRAEAPGIGAGVAEIGDDRSVTIVVTGEGEFHGTLVDLAGQPVASVSLEALGIDDQELALSRPPSGGLDRGAAVTDGNGRFRIGGLRQGKYSIKVDSDCRLPPDLSLSGQVCATGRQPCTLVLGIQCLSVPLLDEHERIVPDARAHCERRMERGREAIATWEAVSCASAKGTATQCFFVTPGATHKVTLWSPSRGLVHEEFEVDASRPQLESTLRLPSEPSSSRLRIKFVLPSGVDLKAHTARIWVGERNSAQPLLEHSERIEEESTIQFEGALPPGRYLVSSNVAFRSWCGNAPHSPEGLAPEEREVQLRHGETTELELWPAVGSRIWIHVLVPSGTLSEKVLGLHALDSAQKFRRVQELDHTEQLWARVGVSGRLGSSLTDLRFLSEPLGGWCCRGLLPGFPGTSVERLPPGRHRLLVDLTGFEPVQLDVEAVDGEDIELTVPMVPQR